MVEQQYPEPAVGALIFNQKGEVFLMKSHKWGGKYVIPGGHIELGESIEDALKREVKEETGLEVRDIEFICLLEFIFGDAFWKRRHFIFLNYACKTDSKKVALNREGQEYIWASVDDLTNISVEPYTRKTIERYLEDKRAS